MDPVTFLRQALPSTVTNTDDSHTVNDTNKIFWTTLTFAQSLDGKIAGLHGKQLILSGKESMLMTHWMRSMHDTILVGVNTVVNDDPQLNTRHLPQRDGGYPQPQPVVLDPSLRIPPNCKLITNAINDKGRFPIVLYQDSRLDPELEQRQIALKELGVTVLAVPSDESNRIPLSKVIEVLQKQGHHSLMVEGGQAVISHCLSRCDGIGVTAGNEETPRMDLVTSTSLGDDLVAAYNVAGA